MATMRMKMDASLDVSICSSRASLRDALRVRERTVYSCLNGYTLRSLLIDHAYDDLLASGRIAFVLDGMLAAAHLRRLGIGCERICGRDLLDDALALHTGPVTVIGGTEERASRLLWSLRGYTARDVSLVTPPMFRTIPQVHEFARSVGPRLPPKSLTVVCIRSPLQDILSGALSSQSPASIFVNVGAVLDDIANDRIREVRLFSRFGIEWLYRLVVSPRRTWPKIAAVLRDGIQVTEADYRWQEL